MEYTIMPNQPSAPDDLLKGKKTGKWSKWGGGEFGVDRQQLNDTWYCQACGQECPKEIKPFVFETRSGFVRMCNRCTHVSRKVDQREGYVYINVVKIVRKTTIY